MKHATLLRTYAIALATLLLAGPALATTDPTGTRPAAPRRAHQTSDTVAKGPTARSAAATTAGKKSFAVAATQRVARTTTLAPEAPASVEQPVSLPAAPQTIKLKGIVLNADGRPCPGASVYPAGAPRQLVVTDAQGAFALPVPVGGAVSLRVEYFGVGSSRVEVAAPNAEVLHITLGQ